MLQYLASDAITLAQKPEEQVLGAYEGVMECFGFFSG